MAIGLFQLEFIDHLSPKLGSLRLLAPEPLVVTRKIGFRWIYSQLIRFCRFPCRFLEILSPIVPAGAMVCERRRWQVSATADWNPSALR